MLAVTAAAAIYCVWWSERGETKASPNCHRPRERRGLAEAAPTEAEAAMSFANEVPQIGCSAKNRILSAISSSSTRAAWIMLTVAAGMTSGFNHAGWGATGVVILGAPLGDRLGTHPGTQ